MSKRYAINWKQFQSVFGVSFFYYYAFHDNNFPINFAIFRSPSDNFEVMLCLILLIFFFTLDKYGDWVHYCFFYQHVQGNVCMKSKMGKFKGMIWLILFVVDLVRKMQNRIFQFVTALFQEKRFFKKKIKTGRSNLKG